MLAASKLAAGIAAAFALTGCIPPQMQSMGAAPLPAYHQPKSTPDGEKQITLSADAYGTFAASGFNVEQVNAGGGALSFEFHPAGAISPLFVNASVAGIAGTLQFGCNDVPCNFDGYNAWLDSKDGDEDYTFWNLQERIVAGAEFNLGSHLFLGAAGGIQFYQGGGDYESKRERLEDARLVENMDERADWRPTASLWFGPRLGESAGSLAIEYGVTFADKVKEWNTTPARDPQVSPRADSPAPTKRTPTPPSGGPLGKHFPSKNFVHTKKKGPEGGAGDPLKLDFRDNCERPKLLYFFF